MRVVHNNEIAKHTDHGSTLYYLLTEVVDFRFRRTPIERFKTYRASQDGYLLRMVVDVEVEVQADHPTSMCGSIRIKIT